MKKKEHPFPVCPDNIIQCWNYADNCRRKARIMAAAARTGSFLITLLFLLILVFFGCAIIYEHTDNTFGAFLESTGFFLPLWQPIAEKLPTGQISLPALSGVLLGAAYCISWLAFAALLALVFLLYHPRTRSLPEGSYADQTQQLEKLAQEARDYSYHTRVVASIPGTILGILALLVVGFWYIVYLEDAAAVTRLLSVFPTTDVTTNCLLYMLVLYLVFGILTSVLIFLCRPLHRYDFPLELVVQAQRAALLAQEEPSRLSEEEQAQKRRDEAARIREDALALERSGAYKPARDALLKAAIYGDIAAMEHYARHCLIGQLKDSARYWLKTCCSHPEASVQARRMLLRMRLKLHHNVMYLQPETAPPTTGEKVKLALKTIFQVLWKAVILAVFIAIVLLLFALFQISTKGSVPDYVPAPMAELLTELTDAAQTGMTAEPAYIPEEVSSFEVPTFSLDVSSAGWGSNCMITDENGDPVVLCYSQDLGGELRVPYYMEPEQTIQNANLCSENIWNLRYMTDQLSYDYQTKTLAVSEAYLMGLAPGEYCIILDDWTYFPLVISQTHSVNSSQRGFAGMGNQNGWIVNDLDAPAAITLSFYNLGDNPIRELIQVRPLANIMRQPETTMDPQHYTIAPNGCSVTLSEEYLALQEPGSYVTFKVRLANGDILDMGYINVGTVRGETTGLVQFQGPESYSLSGSADFVVRYTFPMGGAPMYLSVSTDAQQDILVDHLEDVMGDYVDLEAQTITLPADMLKPHLTAGEEFRIGFSYISSHGQMIWQNYHVQVTW